mgnify:CR=1 FL=1
MTKPTAVGQRSTFLEKHSHPSSTKRHTCETFEQKRRRKLRALLDENMEVFVLTNSSREYNFCLLLSPSSIVAQTVGEMLEISGVITLTCGELQDIFSYTNHNLKLDYLVIDVDGCGGLAALTSQLRDLRISLAETNIILLSSDFDEDDFCGGQMMLADVSLRLPVSYFALDLALVQAPINRSIWNSQNLSEVQNRIGFDLASY